MAYLGQKEKPLQSEELPFEEAPVPDQEPARRERAGRVKGASDTNLASYRIEVGRNHGVEPKHIVGAIANEAHIRSQEIGHIQILDDHCLVDLPPDLPPAIFKKLQTVWVCGQRLQISIAGASQGGRASSKRRAPGKSGKTWGGSKPPYKSGRKNRGGRQKERQK